MIGVVMSKSTVRDELRSESGSLRFQDYISGQEIHPEGKEKEYVAGDMIRQKHNGKNRYFIVDKVETGSQPTAYVRQVKPAFWKSLLLAVLLIGAWFGLDMLFDQLFPF